MKLVKKTNTDGEFAMNSAMERRDIPEIREKIEKIVALFNYCSAINTITEEYPELLSVSRKQNISLQFDFYLQLKKFMQSCICTENASELQNLLDSYPVEQHKNLSSLEKLGKSVAEIVMLEICMNKLNESAINSIMKAFSNCKKMIASIAGNIYKTLSENHVFKRATNEKQLLPELHKIGCDIAEVMILPVPSRRRLIIPITDFISDLGSECKELLQQHPLTVGDAVTIDFYSKESSFDQFPNNVTISTCKTSYFTSNESASKDPITGINKFFLSEVYQQFFSSIWHEVGHENMIYWMQLFKLLQSDKGTSTTLTDTDKFLVHLYKVDPEKVEYNELGKRVCQIISEQPNKKNIVDFQGRKLTLETLLSHALNVAKTPEGIVSFIHKHNDNDSIQIAGMYVYKNVLYLHEWSDFERSFRLGLPIRIGYQLGLSEQQSDALRKAAQNSDLSKLKNNPLNYFFLQMAFKQNASNLVKEFLANPLYFFNITVHFDEKLLCLVHGKTSEEIASYQERVKEYLRKTNQLAEISMHESSK